MSFPVAFLSRNQLCDLERCLFTPSFHFWQFSTQIDWLIGDNCSNCFIVFLSGPVWLLGLSFPIVTGLGLLFYWRWSQSFDLLMWERRLTKVFWSNTTQGFSNSEDIPKWERGEIHFIYSDTWKTSSISTNFFRVRKTWSGSPSSLLCSFSLINLRVQTKWHQKCQVIPTTKQYLQ